MMNALGIAVCKAIGVDISTVSEVSFTSTVGEAELVTVVHAVWNTDTHELDEIREEWAPKVKEPA
jgi:hypothetical protein